MLRSDGTICTEGDQQGTSEKNHVFDRSLLDFQTFNLLRSSRFKTIWSLCSEYPITVWMPEGQLFFSELIKGNCNVCSRIRKRRRECSGERVNG